MVRIGSWSCCACLGLVVAACAPVTPHYGPPGGGSGGGTPATVPSVEPREPRPMPLGSAPRPPSIATARPEAAAPVVSSGPVTAPASAAVTPFQFAFQVGDELAISVWKEKDLDTTQRIQRDGTISPMLLGTLPVVGRTVDQVRQDLEQRYTEYLQQPKVTVRVVNVFSERAFVLGEVRTPSAVALVGPASLLQVLAQAGGLVQEAADQKRVRIVRMGADGKPTLITANVAAMLTGRQPAPMVMPGDVIYVAPTGLADWSRGLTQAVGPIASLIGAAGGVVTSYAAIKTLDNNS